MKYLLVEVIERDISTPELFDTHEAAYDRMCEHVARVCGSTIESVKETCSNNEEDGAETCVLENEAWSERHGNNFDWKIFTIQDCGLVL